MPARLIGFVIVAVTALAAATATLASVHERIRSGRAWQHFEQGGAAADRGDLNAALADYRASLSLDRGNLDAERELAFTLQALGYLAEAETYFVHLLHRDPTNGPLNRGLARIQAARGNSSAARASYQRALFGEWPDSSARIETQFEFVGYLKGQGATDEIVPELLRLKTDVPAGATEAVRRVADLLIEHGAQESALDMLRAASIAAPRDLELLAHLAGAQARAGRTADARATLARGVALDPRREDLRARLSLAERVLALDPTLPRLGLVARTRRARALLDSVLHLTRSCETVDVLSALRAEATHRSQARSPSDAHLAEVQIDLASRIWEASTGCRASTGEAQAIEQVLQHVHATEAASQ
jgi:tetratricopeptide (TPR) repeat protein